MAKSGKSTRSTVSTETPVITWSITRRRKLMGGMTICGTLVGEPMVVVGLDFVSGNASRRLASRYAPHHKPGKRVDHNGDKEQRQANLNQRRKIEIGLALFFVTI